MRSSVAAEVRPPAIGEHEPMQGTYFTYWDGVALDRIEVYVRPDRAVYGWMTNDELALVGVNWSARDYQAVRGTVERSYLDVLEGVAPALAGRMRGARRAGRWIGGSVPGFLRRPYGPGWALVGDAGYHKDPVTAQGISDAFRDAERLADAVDAGLSGRRPLAQALADYEMRRNQAVMAMFEFTTQMARLEPPPADMVQLFTALQGNHEQISRFLGVLAATVPVEQFFSPDNLAQVFAASTRG
jgi:2-polyprenyl-6-methoxyphenol hydroxylase-like FAD-dependent oxidoreductase